MRLVLLLLVMGALVMWGPFLFFYWKTFRPWYIRGLMVVLAFAWVYVLDGQSKAFDLHIPFDQTSWRGVLAFVLIDGFLVIALSVKAHGYIQELKRGKR